MQILPDDKKDIPVTVTLKAETAMHLLVAMVNMPQVRAEEMVKFKEAFTDALGI